MSDSSEKSQYKEDLSDSADRNSDPLVEVHRISGHELARMSQISRLDIRGMVVRCTSCLHQINHNDVDKVMKHFRLGVLVCKDCHEFYGTSEFSQDENGKYNYCTWCGNGGKLYLCDFCPYAFCSTCVRRNFGRSEVSEMTKDDWKCYMCVPEKLKAKVAFCDLILNYSQTSKHKREKRLATQTLLNISGSSLNWSETESWVLPAFDKADDACKTFHKRLDKLKQIGTTQSKSLRHVIKKMEEVINTHKTELNSVVKSLSLQYNSFLEKKKKADAANLKFEETESNGHSKGKKEKTIDNATKESSDEDKKMDTKDRKVSKIDIDDRNYKAKMLLLEDGSSDVSENSVETKDAEQCGNKSKDPPLKDVYENKDTWDSHPNGFEEIVLSDDELVPTQQLGRKASVASVSVKPSKTTKDRKGKSPVSRKLFPDSSPEASSSSISVLSDSDCEKSPKKRGVAKRVQKSKPKILDYNDPKLKLRAVVVLENCADILPDGATTIPLPAKYVMEDLDKDIKSCCKMPMKQRIIKEKPEKKGKVEKKKKTSVSEKVVKISGSSSSSICLSSDDEEDELTKKGPASKPKPKLSANALAKKGLLEDSEESSMSEASESNSDGDKKKKKKGKPHSDSSEDFQPRKKRKFDKLLSKRIASDDDSGSKDSEKPKVDKKKPGKRKTVFLDDEAKDKRSGSDQSSTSESDEDKDKKKKKRKRVKKIASSSSENEGDKNKTGDESKNTPGKGRKNIKKILSKKDLALETKEAQIAERERKKRLQERQKQYNTITDTSPDGKEIITRKFVLEVDPISKEEVVQIHPDLCEKLKPHQVKGVQFMYECTIESLKELDKKKGSGCILAHCMGLGKTLQVITFLHTCLTNKFVNKKIRTAMVICPYNTILNWAKEFDMWLGPVDGEVTVHELVNAKDNFMRMDILEYWQRDGGVLITSYDIFRRLAADKIAKLNKKKREKLHELIIDPGPDIVICDEGHILKNESSAISKACAMLRTERRIVLTGTPLQNNLKEYHCMLSFVKPYLLGTAKEFRNRFVNPIINGQYDDSTDHDVKRMKKRIHILHKLLDGCVQRCDYSALTKFLPPKHEYVISVKLSEVQKKMYRWYLDNKSRHKDETKIKGGTLFADYNVLRNLCTHPYIVHTSFQRAEQRRILNDDGEEDETFINDDSEESEKNASSSSSEAEEVIKTYRTRSRKEEDGDLEEEEEAVNKQWYHEFITDEDRNKLELSGKMMLLVDILKRSETIGDKVVVFSQSLLTLDAIEDFLEIMDSQPLSEEDKHRDIIGRWVRNLDYFRMDGSTSADFRKQYIDLFNNPDHDRSRLFLVSTKAGGLGTNLVGANRVVMLDASWNPSHDVQAIFRVFRFGQHKPVYIYRLLAQGTMEEKIYDRQVNKLSLSIRVVDEQQIDRHFNAAELAELYNFEPDAMTIRPTPMVPKDALLADLLMQQEQWIMTYHEHDSLLQNKTEEDLTEEERQAAWTEYENEREGRNFDEMNIDDEMSEYCKEPDFAEVDYVGDMIPNCKSMIENIIASLRKRFPTFSTAELRKQLLISIRTLMRCFQEKHNKILKMKQEYVARGSVPTAVNKYLAELTKVFKDLSKHQENINMIVQNDAKVSMQEYAVQMQKLKQQQQQLKQQQQYQQQQQKLNNMQRPANHQQFLAGARPVFIPQPPLQNFVRAPANYPQFPRMNQNNQARMQQFPGGVNPGLLNNNAPRFFMNTGTNARVPFNFPYVKNPIINVTSSPIVTEPIITEMGKDDLPTINSNTKSTVTIEEIE